MKQPYLTSHPATLYGYFHTIILYKHSHNLTRLQNMKKPLLSLEPDFQALRQAGIDIFSLNPQCRFVDNVLTLVVTAKDDLQVDNLKTELNKRGFENVGQGFCIDTDKLQGELIIELEREDVVISITLHETAKTKA